MTDQFSARNVRQVQHAFASARLSSTFIRRFSYTVAARQLAMP